MRATAWLLTVSLAANGLLFLRWQRPAAPTAAPPSSAPPAVAPPPASEAAAISAHTWERLQPHDATAFVAEMRRRGFPPFIMRAIVGEHLHERFADRYRAIATGIDASPFWNAPAFAYVAPEVEKARGALVRDVADAMRELLGDDMVDLVRLRRSYGDHPPEKLLDLDRINADYRTLIGDVRARNAGVMSAGDRAQLALLERSNAATSKNSSARKASRPTTSGPARRPGACAPGSSRFNRRRRSSARSSASGGSSTPPSARPKT